jgi:hypothetical protein
LTNIFLEAGTKKYYINEEKVNVRGSAGLNGNVIGILKTGDEIVITGTTEEFEQIYNKISKWYKIKSSKIEGYIWGGLFSTNGDKKYLDSEKSSLAVISQENIEFSEALSGSIEKDFFENRILNTMNEEDKQLFSGLYEPYNDKINKYFYYLKIDYDDKSKFKKLDMYTYVPAEWVIKKFWAIIKNNKLSMTDLLKNSNKENHNFYYNGYKIFTGYKIIINDGPPISGIFDNAKYKDNNFSNIEIINNKGFKPALNLIVFSLFESAVICGIEHKYLFILKDNKLNYLFDFESSVNCDGGHGSYTKMIFPDDKEGIKNKLIIDNMSYDPTYKEVKENGKIVNKFFDIIMRSIYSWDGNNLIFEKNYEIMKVVNQ